MIRKVLFLQVSRIFQASGSFSDFLGDFCRGISRRSEITHGDFWRALHVSLLKAVTHSVPDKLQRPLLNAISSIVSPWSGIHPQPTAVELFFFIHKHLHCRHYCQLFTFSSVIIHSHLQLSLTLAITISLILTYEDLYQSCFDSGIYTLSRRWCRTF